MRMRRIILLTSVCLSPQYFSTLPHKRHDLGGGGVGEVTEQKNVFWFSLQILPEIFLSLRRTERDMIKNVCWS